MAAPQAHLSTFSYRRSAIALGVAIACYGTAFAQTQSSEAATDNQTLTEVVVTGSRISNPGFEAPTPLTVVGAAEMRQAGYTDISATLTDLPQFRGTYNANNTNSVTNSGQSPADLRGLGYTRTLMLVNGRRYISNDLQTVPYSLVKRIDVVTGGASAAYGSDAVAGVVNIILDDEREGLEIGAQGGVSTHGDAGKQMFELSYGTHVGERGHFLFGADYLKDEGVQPATRRPKVGGAGFFPGADGLLYPTANLKSNDHSIGGLILTGALAGQTFNPDGTLRPFQYGRLNAGSPRTMVGGDPDAYVGDQYRSVVAPIERTNVFARFSYDVTDSLKLWAEGTYNKVGNNRAFFSDLVFNAIPIEMSADNPFLDPAVRAQLSGAGETSFQMGRALTDMSLNYYNFSREASQFTVGLDGQLAGGKYRYNAYYGHGKQEQNLRLTDITITQEFFNAIDAVTGPGGTPVCRVALTDPTTACRPLNLFGTGRADPAAVAYATGDWNLIETTWLDIAGASISGDLFDLWNEPVSFATGVEYRKEQLQDSYDPVSLANRFTLINGVNIPKTSINVKEAFLEVAAPLLVDVPFVKKLTFNGAARISDYSLSGSIWSWKGGLTWDIVDSVKLRGTRSRDIRAPNLMESYATPGTLFTTVQDLGTAGEPIVNVVQRTGGNVNLSPEIADTTTVGVVLSPSFVPGLQLSVDYYDIKIEDVIIDPTAQEVVNACYQAGDQSKCDLIVRDSTGKITDIYGTLINLQEMSTKGVDVEASYRRSLEKLPGQLSVRALATYVDTIKTGGFEGAGYVGAQASFLVPKWRGQVTFTYESDRFGGDVRARYIDSAGFAPEDVFGGLGDNSVSSRTYFDLGLRTYIPMGDDGRLTFFGSVQNVFDTEQPLATVNTAYYDQIGRFFSLGVRASF